LVSSASIKPSDREPAFGFEDESFTNESLLFARLLSA